MSDDTAQTELATQSSAAEPLPQAEPVTFMVPAEAPTTVLGSLEACLSELRKHATEDVNYIISQIRQAFGG